MAFCKAGLLLALALVAQSGVGSVFARPEGKLHRAVENLKNDALAFAFKNIDKAFEEFVILHKKNQTGYDHHGRRKIFRANVLRAIENQLNDPSAVHGITQFSDLNEDEFARNNLGLKKPKSWALQDHPVAPKLPTEGLPEEFDWREKGAVTEIKNQGICGSCYAFSTVGAIEGAHFLQTGDLISLSEQQIVDCDQQCDPSYHDVCDAGCMGGLMNNALEYVERAGGLEREADYPYAGVGGECKFDTSKVAATVSSFATVPIDEEQIAANLVKNGPLAVAINAAWMQTYVSGVSCPLICNKRALDHGVLIVGYGASGWSPARLRRKPYWIIKNSWGATWGEQGYYRICSGRNECGLDDLVSTVLSPAVVSTQPQQGTVEVA